MKHFESHGIRLVGGYQAWSNPSMLSTEAAIGIILARPTLLDIMDIVREYGADKISSENDRLKESKMLSHSQWARNQFWIDSIK